MTKDLRTTTARLTLTNLKGWTPDSYHNISNSYQRILFLPLPLLGPLLLSNMASLNTSTNGPSIKSSYTGVVNSAAPSGPAAKSPTYGQWAVFSVSAPLVNAFQQDSGGKESVLKVQSTGGTIIPKVQLPPVACADYLKQNRGGTAGLDRGLL